MSLMIPEARLSPIYIPALPSLSLSDDERVLIMKLQSRGWRERPQMELCDAYYRGMQVITNLRIAVPPELEFLRTIVGWPRIAVDPLVERLAVDGFRLPGSTVSDPDLEDIWISNGMDSEQALLFTDAFVMKCGWITIGSPESKGDAPVMCVESPLNMAAMWDARSAKPTALLQTYWLDERRHAALYIPNQTIHIGEDDNHVWQITGRDVHNFGMVSAVRLANAARTSNRDGASEITAEVMSLTDAGCRTLLGLEVARELYSVPQKIILGSTEEDFVDKDGKKKSTWSTYITRVLGLERDEDGQLPDIKQFTAYNPEVFTKLIEMYACQMAGILGANPQDLGLYTQGNPVSAESNASVDSRRDRKARHKQRMSSRALCEAMQMAVRFRNGTSALPDNYRRMAADWMDPTDFNLAGATDAMSKQASMGSVSPSSDVVMKKMGWSEIERAQLKVDRDRDAGLAVLAQLASSMQEREARADKTVAADIAPSPAPAVPPAPAPTAPPNDKPT